MAAVLTCDGDDLPTDCEEWLRSYVAFGIMNLSKKACQGCEDGHALITSHKPSMPLADSSEGLSHQAVPSL